MSRMSSSRKGMARIVRIPSTALRGAARISSGMPDMDPEDRSFEETLRSIAGELGSFIERSIESVDVDRFAESVGVDPESARDWVDGAGSWLRGNAENLGEEM